MVFATHFTSVIYLLNYFQWEKWRARLDVYSLWVVLIVKSGNYQIDQIKKKIIEKSQRTWRCQSKTKMVSEAEKPLPIFADFSCKSQCVEAVLLEKGFQLFLPCIKLFIFQIYTSILTKGSNTPKNLTFYFFYQSKAERWVISCKDRDWERISAWFEVIVTPQFFLKWQMRSEVRMILFHVETVTPREG